MTRLTVDQLRRLWRYYDARSAHEDAAWCCDRIAAALQAREVWERLMGGEG